MEKKLLKKSKFAVTLYVISGLLTLYTVYMLYSTITYLTNYFSQYGTSFMSNFGTAIGYILTQCLVYLVYAILVFAAAKIYNEVRKANPDNYLSEAESKAILRAKEAKKIAKAEKKNKCKGSAGNRRKSRSNRRAEGSGKGGRERSGRRTEGRIRKIIACFSKYNLRQKTEHEKAVESIHRFFF